MNGEHILNGAMKETKKIMEGTYDTLRKMQPARVGFEKRSPKEVARLRKQLEGMDDPTRMVKMAELANLAGHQGKEMDNCEMCKFMKETNK